MKRFFTLVTLFCIGMGFATAQVPSQSEDVMLQAFYWNSHSETNWSKLKNQAAEIGSSFTLVWLPPASNAEFGGSSNMGYHPYQWCNLSSSWGNQSQLTQLIEALHNNNCKVIADIVINHHAGNNECCSFPKEDFGTYGSYTFNASCVTKTDESGKGQGGDDYGHGDNPSGNYGAARDLDHNNETVQKACKAYLQWMKNVIGYDGWRYDFVKGFNGANNKMYNQAAGGYMSVGEYYDASYDEMVGWVRETGYNSMVFDFAFHDAMTKWGGGSDYGKLAWMDGNTPRPAGVCHSPSSRKYAVTFVENHDTDEKHTDGNWPYRGDWDKANAIMLAAPGIPCVFWRHWTACKSNIQKMIAARKSVGIHSESDVVVNNTNGYYQSTAIGKRGRLICFVGSGWSAPAGYTLACQGNGWAYYTSTEGGNAGGGTQGGGQQGGGTQGGGTQGGGGVSGSAFFMRINGSTDYAANPVNETDFQGREQYMASVYVKAGQKISCYDKDNNQEWTIPYLDPYGAYKNFTMSGTGSSAQMTCNVEGCYDFYIKLKYGDDMIYVGEGTNCTSQGSSSQGGGTQGGGTQGGGSTGTGVTVKVDPASTGWSGSMYVHAWTGVSPNNVDITSWPGVPMTKDANGWWTYTFDKSSVNVIFNNGSGKQTDDIYDVSSSTCFKITSDTHLNMWQNPVYETELATCPSGGTQGGGEQQGGNQQGGSTSGSIKVGFKAPASWTSCNAYAWIGNGTTATKLLGEWPGTPVSKSGDLYYATVPATDFNIIFNNGSEQTDDINGITADVCYDGSNLTYTEPWPMPSTMSCDGSSQGGSQGGGSQGGSQGGSNCGSSDHLWYFKGYINGANLDGIEGDNVFDGGVVSYNFTKDSYVFVIYQVHGVAGVQYMTPSYVSGVTHTTLLTTGNDKMLVPAGTKKLYLYDNGDGTVEISTQPIPGKTLMDACDTNSAEESDSKELAIYPNPVADVLNIQSDTEFDSAMITNLAGQTMLFSVSNNQIAVGSLSKGLYIISLASEDGTVEKAKFIKK